MGRWDAEFGEHPRRSPALGFLHPTLTSVQLGRDRADGIRVPDQLTLTQESILDYGVGPMGPSRAPVRETWQRGAHGYPSRKGTPRRAGPTLEDGDQEPQRGGS